MSTSAIRARPAFDTVATSANSLSAGTVGSSNTTECLVSGKRSYYGGPHRGLRMQPQAGKRWLRPGRSPPARDVGSRPTLGGLITNMFIVATLICAARGVAGWTIICGAQVPAQRHARMKLAARALRSFCLLAFSTPLAIIFEPAVVVSALAGWMNRFRPTDSRRRDVLSVCI